MKRIVLAAWLVIGSVAAGAQQEWVHVGQDPGHTKYSTLDQFNVDNVQTLQRAWTFHTGDKTGFFESTPLVVSDVMYVSAQNGVFALDPATGAQRWKFETLGNTRRGLAYWRATRASARGCSLARAHGCSRSTRRPASWRWSSVRAASSRWGQRCSRRRRSTRTC